MKNLTLSIINRQYHQSVLSKNIVYPLAKNRYYKICTRYINTGQGNVKQDGFNSSEINYTENMPKAVRVPIMKILYGVIFFMAAIPICQSLYETNKYYEENKHLYEQGKK
ncbi:conserved protein, unknown function [Hepatocystis sp. ex Piliocolobus tephrosceles]|nr:conserved protein, unknown function [Hepatocystis sp. ex Piliocolobus tephrosceles]